MTIYELFKSIINGGNYSVEDMERKIDTLYIEGKLTEEQRTELIALTSTNANDNLQIDIVAKLKDLEDRIFALEHKEPEYVIWYAGYVTKQGEIVKFDYNGDNEYDLLRYDGGRSETSLRPGKIDGWHVVDAEGNILGTYYNGEFTPIGE